VAKHRSLTGFLAVLRAQMVNGGFPNPSHYGFELVDAEHARAVSQFGVNRKFTANQIIRISHDFSTN
jgi:hypothetical protein